MSKQSQANVLVHMISDTLGRDKVERGGDPQTMIYQRVRNAGEMACDGNPVNMRARGASRALGNPARRRVFNLAAALRETRTTQRGIYPAGDSFVVSSLGGPPQNFLLCLDRV